MVSRNDVNLLIASSIQWHMDRDYQVGLDDNHLFLMTKGQVFRIRVEEIEKISKHPKAEEEALNFMRTLPYEPD